ncbi:hypothetical protein [Pseudobacteriovorax antillogorgiicola]|uniref:Uncharacterized protein n=1 Tax=Pseudobacteriovorax antillogorgiicola TaxID=1513793 RepID=A0A1Y6BHQ4_9BACT|nr:hypothetical protein [Pseudobacteriovorax antillogorgiicola]TCS55448.1 hypothetical protein EDD56_105169 [Pseudobacteriovorax antillogorgiicola]SMF12343.1 hypothetical protein SAMN06296036_105155 [Pseudobacteriovorax antillogorgiicola]
MTGLGIILLVFLLFVKKVENELALKQLYRAWYIGLAYWFSIIIAGLYLGSEGIIDRGNLLIAFELFFKILSTNFVIEAFRAMSKREKPRLLVSGIVAVQVLDIVLIFISMFMK